jgi:hypothetical protein
MKRSDSNRQPTSRLPPQIKGDRIDGFGIRQPAQRLQSDHTGHHIGGHTGPAPTRREHIREHLIRKQLLSMASQKPKKAARLQKMPS